jgi:long-chain acyl-CoA synthetase
MDVTTYLEPKIAPRAVFDRLDERRSRVRFMLPASDGSDDWRAVTWGAFAKQIERCSLFLLSGLTSGGMRMGDRAAIFAGNRVEWLSAALGIQAAGGVIVPIYPSNTAEQAAYVAEHSDARVVFVDGALLLQRIFEQWSAYRNVERIVLLDDAIDVAKVLSKVANAPAFADVERVVVTWSRSQSIGEARGREEPSLFMSTMDAVSLDQPGLMLYTSGTTGNPKGVPLTHRNISINGADWLRCNAPLVDEGMVDLLWLPMSHIFGFGEACLGNTLGWVSYLADPRTVIEKLPIVRPHVFMSVPSVWEKLASGDIRKATGGNLKFCLSGGAGLKREVKEKFHSVGLLIIEGYGLTETSPTLTLNRPDAFRFDSVGKVLPSVQLKLAEDGEILAKGPTVFSGYHKDPSSTAQAFTEDGWFKTGDVGRFTDDGFLQIIDRKKDILVTAGGKNVPPANIELKFADDPFLAHVVVYGDGKKFLVAGVWLNEDAVRAHLADVSTDAQPAARRALVQTRIDKVNATLASYETIKTFHVFDRPLTVEGGMLTPTLKVRRKKVYELFREHFEALYAAPSSMSASL